MKYLKLFESSTYKIDVFKNLNEILYELNDMGITTYVLPSLRVNSDRKFIKIIFNSKINKENIDIILDVIIQIIKYMYSEGFYSILEQTISRDNGAKYSEEIVTKDLNPIPDINKLEKSIYKNEYLINLLCEIESFKLVFYTKKTNEEVDLDRYNDFSKRYKKSGYISKNNKNNLDKIGIGANTIDTLNGIVENDLNFFKKIDLDLLSDLLIYAEDDSPYNIVSKKIGFFTNINSKSKRWFLFRSDFNDNFPLLNNMYYELDYNKIEFKERYDIVNNIINSIGFYKNRVISDEAERTKNASNDSNKLSYFDKLKIKKNIEPFNIFEVITSNRILILSIIFSDPKYVYYDYNNEYDPELESGKIKSLRDKINSFQDYLKTEIFDRVFGDIQYKIENNLSYHRSEIYDNTQINFKITFKN